MSEQLTETTAPTMDETMAAAFDRAEGIVTNDEVKVDNVEETETTEEFEAQADESEEIAEVEQEVEEAQAPTLATAPESWTTEAKSKFSELPDWAQAEVLKREGDFEKGIAKYAEKSQFADTIKNVVKPYEGLIAQEGGTVDRAIADLLQTAATLRIGTPQQKEQLLRQTAAQFGINLGEPQSDVYVDPDIKSLKDEIGNLRAQLGQQQYTQQQQIVSEAEKVINKFKEGKEFFEDVKHDMSKLLNAGVANDLQEAYDAAVKLNPTVSEKVQRAAQLKKLEEAKKVAKDAKKVAGKQIKQKSAQVQPKKLTIDETLSMAYDRAMGN